jgi:hypothetical protein
LGGFINQNWLIKKIKKFTQKSLGLINFEIKRTPIKDSKAFLVEEEVLGMNYTLVPGMGYIELPFSYKFFEWYYPTCELQTKKWIVDNYKPGWISFDIGANIGYYSILFSKLAKNGFCYSFEPTDTYELLEKNLEHNKVTNCRVNKIGIGNENISKDSPIFKMWGKPPINEPF